MGDAGRGCVAEYGNATVMPRYMKKICFLLSLMVIATQGVFAQYGNEYMLKSIYGDMPTDSFLADIKRNHVQEVQYITNGGKHVATIRFDKAGHTVYWKQDLDKNADSMVYSASGALLRHYSYGAEGPGAYTRLDADTSRKEHYYTNYIVDKDGKEKKGFHATVKRTKDTVYTWNYQEYGGYFMDKEYIRDSVEYNIEYRYSSKGVLEKTTYKYNVYDKQYKNNSKKYKLLEAGELNFKESVGMVMMNTIQAMMQSGKVDTPFLRELYGIGGRDPDYNQVKELYRKHKVPMPQLLPERKADVKYIYEHKHGEKLAMYMVRHTYGNEYDTYEYYYNDKYRVSRIMQKVENGTVDVECFYNDKGLLAGKKVPLSDESNEEYRYVFFD